MCWVVGVFVGYYIFFWVNNGVGFFLCLEYCWGDLNGDGDILDCIVIFFECWEEVLRNFGVVSFGFYFSGCKIVFRVWEILQSIDFMGNGSVNDSVFFFYD